MNPDEKDMKPIGLPKYGIDIKSEMDPPQPVKQFFSFPVEWEEEFL